MEHTPPCPSLRNTAKVQGTKAWNLPCMLSDARTTRIQMTRDEYYLLSQERERGLVDWEDGVAIQMAPAYSRHGYFILNLVGPLDQFLRSGGLGKAWQETFVDFAERTCGADGVVLFTAHLDRHRKGRIKGPPDIVLEVVSPDSESRDRGAKFEEYWKQGVPWYWIGDPQAVTLEEFRYTPDGYLRIACGTLEKPFEPSSLPGFCVHPGRLVDDESDSPEQPE